MAARLKVRAIAAMAASAAVAALSLAACSSGPPPVSESSHARATLAADVERVRYCVAVHQPEAAKRELSRLRRDVARLEADGQMSKAAGDQVLSALLDVEKELYLLTPATTTTTTTSPPAATTTTTEPGSAGSSPHGHGHGHGHGSGGDGGGS